MTFSGSIENRAYASPLRSTPIIVHRSPLSPTGRASRSAGSNAPCRPALIRILRGIRLLRRRASVPSRVGAHLAGLATGHACQPGLFPMRGGDV